MKKILIAACLVAVFVLALAVSLKMHVVPVAPPAKFDVAIPMSASRPGCEKASWCYTPPQITVDAGRTVTWLNDDSGLHTVTSGYYNKPDGTFDSGQIDPGETFSYKFVKSGDFHYFCSLHPWMEGTVTVK